MADNLTVEDLAQIIRDNPGCAATVDNDCWWINRTDLPEPRMANFADEDAYYEALNKWEEERTIVSDSDMGHTYKGYGSGSSYGGDILQALALIVGISVESV